MLSPSISLQMLWKLFPIEAAMYGTVRFACWRSATVMRVAAVPGGPTPLREAAEQAEIELASATKTQVELPYIAVSGQAPEFE